MKGLGITALAIFVAACGSDAPKRSDATDPVDVKDIVLSNRSPRCADHQGNYAARVSDLQRAAMFESSLEIKVEAEGCWILSNNIPNHDFNDATGDFGPAVRPNEKAFFIRDDPVVIEQPEPLNRFSYNGVMLNGVPIDLLSNGCYDPTNSQADAQGNVGDGCFPQFDWLLEPLGTPHKFGVDLHHAHTQPSGTYHYHANPMALFDDTPGGEGSPVIGFAADGFPIYGSYFRDPETGMVRKARSGYTLKSGTRPAPPAGPGGRHSGMYVQDWEWTGAGDLDACNGMTVDGQYGYYVTEAYPWILGCFSGEPHESFDKSIVGELIAVLLSDEEPPKWAAE